MILSVSRRTDIPNYYADWFYNRIKEGFLYVRNPMNPHQISKINLSPDIVDCIVFWTKNPENMLSGLDKLKDYACYFQFTLTGYGRDIEPGIPHKRNCMIEIFRRLSDKIGHDRVIWRYDPILFNDIYTEAYHLRAFQEIAESLKGYTDSVVISFVDLYAKIKRNMESLKLYQPADKEMLLFAEKLAAMAKENHMTIEACAERIDLKEAGVRHGSCIDKKRIEKIIGCRIEGGKDKNQREECGCLESVEIGTYDTCKNGCRYCYASFSSERVKSTTALYDADSPLLCGKIGPDDIVTERKVKSLKAQQLSFFEK